MPGCGDVSSATAEITAITVNTVSRPSSISSRFRRGTFLTT